MKTRCFRELSLLSTFEERFEYLRLDGQVGESTFGHDRWVNQLFYTSVEWHATRDWVIYRDNGCDLGVPGYEIHRGLLVHHMTPVSRRDIESGAAWILDPEFLITTTLRTHNAIHYGNDSLLPRAPVTRQPGDTKLW